MTDPDDDSAPPPPRSRFRRVRKITRWFFGVLGVVVLVALVARWQFGRVAQRNLDAVTARLDATEPDWQLDALLDARGRAEPPPNRDPVPVILGVAEDVPAEWQTWRNSATANRWVGGHGNNHLPPQAVRDDIRGLAPCTLLIRTEAVRLRDARGGRFPLTIDPNPIASLFPHLQKARSVASVLQYDGALAALEKNPNRGISAARASLTVARTIGDEPLLISQIVRTACATIAAQTAMQVIAWGEPTEGLAELQAELLAEAEFPYLRTGMRGERAMLDKLFCGLEDGTITLDGCFRYAGISDPGPEHYAAFRAYRAFIPGDHAKALEIVTAYVVAAGLPPHEQLAALKQVTIPKGPPDEYRYILTRLSVPACEKAAAGALRTRAELLSAAACVACERFRQKHGRWPRDLAELAPAFLPAVPVSPFDGAPIGYRVLADRVAVYCLWADSPFKTDEPDFRTGTAPGVGIGYRVWSPDRRGLPAEETKDP